jgi:calcium-dependent protein kinase
MELCTGGTLLDYFKKRNSLSEMATSIIMRQALQGVSYLHANNICHRDLKLENFVFAHQVDDRDVRRVPVKMIDFGLSCVCKEGDVLTECVGTKTYIAPEVMEQYYGRPCDLWSCGVMTYIMLLGKKPFANPEREQVLRKMRDGIIWFNPSVATLLTEDAREFMQGLLTLSQRRRWLAQRALKSAWIHTTAPQPSPDASSQLDSSLVDDLAAFRARNKLAQAALRLTARELDDMDISDLRDAFTAWDVDADGLVSLDELQAGLRRDLGINSRGIRQKLADIMQSVDDKGTGALEYSSFLAAALEHRLRQAHPEEGLEEAICKQAFAVFDLDGDGKISKEEVMQVVRAVRSNGGTGLRQRTRIGKGAAKGIGEDFDQGVDSRGKRLTEENLDFKPRRRRDLDGEADEILRETDKNGDGYIDYREFRAMLQRTASEAEGTWSV